jgi:hypothetical protein
VFTNSYWSPTLVALTPSNVATPVGAVVYLYQTLRYAFAPSGVLTGRRALWRSVIGATTQRDELVTPYDGSTHFEYLIGDELDVIHTPSPLTDVRAVRFRVIGASEHAPEGKTAPTTFNLTTDLFFRNRAN